MTPHSQPTTLLVLDMQTHVNTLPKAPALLHNVAAAIAHARTSGIPVFYVVVGFRQGTPEISVHNKSFARAKERLANANMEEMMQIEPTVAPQPGELVITKRRFSAFTGSDLEVVLRAFGIQHLVLTGVTSSGVVLSTVREAADKDYRLTVLSDGCADRDAEVQQVLMTKIFPMQADVLTVAEWCGL